MSCEQVFSAGKIDMSLKIEPKASQPVQMGDGKISFAINCKFEEIFVAPKFAIDCKAVTETSNAEDRPSSQTLSETARELVAYSLSENTRKGYRADLLHYAATGRAIPSTPETIAEYLAESAETYAVATLQRRLAAISKAHRAIGADDPCRSEIVQAVMRGIRRSRGVARRQAQPRSSVDEQLRVDQHSRFHYLMAWQINTGSRRAVLPRRRAA